jgi:exonuclease SbcD
MRIAHTADWHLGPARNRIDPESGLNARLIDFFECAQFAVSDAIERGAELILHAGDVFNTPRPSPTERHLALDAFAPAIMAQVPVVVIVGNHDMPRSPAEWHALDVLRGVPAITVIDLPELLNVWRIPATDVGGGTDEYWQVAPARIPPPDEGHLMLQIACLPWPNKSLLLREEETRKLEPGQINLIMREKMMDVARAQAAELRRDVPAVFLGHFSVDLAAAGTQNRLMMLGGEWTLNAAELLALPYSYFALGHIHKPQRALFDGSRSMVYAGSPEAVTFGEEGEEKGYLMVTVPPAGDADFEWVGTPYRRFITITPSGGKICPDDVQGAIVRIRVPEAEASDIPEIRRNLEAAGAVEIAVEIERAESQRRAGAVEVSHEMDVEAAIRAWGAQRPDIAPLLDALVAQGLMIDRMLGQRGEPQEGGRA